MILKNGMLGKLGIGVTIVIKILKLKEQKVIMRRVVTHLPITTIHPSLQFNNILAKVGMSILYV